MAKINNTLQIIKELVYDKHNFKFDNLKEHREGSDYGACSFDLSGYKIEHRVSNITPTKIGQFVAIWKRNSKGITAPFDLTDDFDFMIITSKCDDKIGQFIFSKNVLITQGIISKNEAGGKRGIRVYPPWDIAPNRQAEKTQKWQLNYFFMQDTFPMNLSNLI